MRTFKSVFLGIIFLVSTVSYGKGFENFLGKYKVISRMCPAQDRLCESIQELEIARSPFESDLLELIEVTPEKQLRYSLQEFGHVDSYGNRAFSLIESAGNLTASLIKYTEWGMEAGKSIETRNITKVGDLYQYSHRYRLMGNSDGHTVYQESALTLAKQPNLTATRN